MLHTVFGDTAMHASRVPQLRRPTHWCGDRESPHLPPWCFIIWATLKKTIGWHEPWNPELFFSFRDPFIGLWDKPLYNWVGCHPLYIYTLNSKQPGFFLVTAHLHLMGFRQKRIGFSSKLLNSMVTWVSVEVHRGTTEIFRVGGNEFHPCLIR